MLEEPSVNGSSKPVVCVAAEHVSPAGAALVRNKMCGRYNRRRDRDVLRGRPVRNRGPECKLREAEVTEACGHAHSRDYRAGGSFHGLDLECSE